MGRESGNIAHASATHRRTILCDANNLFYREILSLALHASCAARDSTLPCIIAILELSRELDSIFGIEQSRIELTQLTSIALSI
jgi:hypothetical protein